MAREVHNLARDERALRSQTVSIAKVEKDGVSSLYASGSGASLNPRQREKLEELGVPKENIFSGKKFKVFIDGERGIQTKLANHAERVIERNIPLDSEIKEFGISWSSKQKNEMCPNCKEHFGHSH
ncbi:hypothetical protein [Apibacter adventoris]|uniref:Bacterial deaminase MsddA-like domain-containing protein n=1 Tax=Apibacter adventoris TaxID=1679466 RepID=A0A2S8AG27_9FLAO|nr:hypothetical protein [Apibacter adventoris]PQL95248.1 hypothetical protein C4S77_00120 [Apibacter adventoris]